MVEVVEEKGAAVFGDEGDGFDGVGGCGGLIVMGQRKKSGGF